MFTGLIQDVGEVLSVEKQGDSLSLRISTKLGQEHLSTGASVACNGCCLTVTKALDGVFYVDLGPETLKATMFHAVQKGQKINLEPALRVGDPMGGHYVTGHVDTCCQIVSFFDTPNGFKQLEIDVPHEFSQFVIPKGNITICGISLTIAQIAPHSGSQGKRIQIMLIPHTLSHTNLLYFAVNSKIEVEFCYTVKSVASVLRGMVSSYSVL